MPERPVRIGDGSWLGHGTVVLPGATIGRHVVIGANSVVRGDIPDFTRGGRQPGRSVLRRMRPGPTDQPEVVGGAHAGMRLSPAKRVDLLADRDAVDDGLGERLVAPGPQVVAERPPVLEVRAVVGFPERHQLGALVPGRLDGHDVVEHRLEDVGRPVDDVAALGEHRRVVVVDLAEVGEVLALRVGRLADRLGARRTSRPRRCR